MRKDAGVLLDVLGGMTKGIRDESRCDFIPVVVGCIEVVMKGCVGRGVVVLKVEAEAAEGFTGTEEGVVGGSVAQTLTLHAILLVNELQSRVRDLVDSCFIQRGGRSVVHATIDGEVNVLEQEGLTLGIVAGRGLAVFSRPEEPEEGNNDEEDRGVVGLSIGGVLGVDGFEEGTDDGSVDGLDTPCGLVLVPERLDKSSE